jgi:hypothetical protein
LDAPFLWFSGESFGLTIQNGLGSPFRTKLHTNEKKAQIDVDFLEKKRIIQSKKEKEAQYHATSIQL